MPATPVLRTPDDFLAAIPALLGFYPTDSLVAVVMRGGTVEVTARWDLNPVALRAGARWLSRRVRDAPARPKDGRVRVFFAGYGDPAQVNPAFQVAISRVPDLVMGAVLVAGDRYWYNGQSPELSYPVPHDPWWSLVLGEPVLHNRADVAALVAPPTVDRERVLAGLLPDARDLVDDDPVVAGGCVLDLMGRWQAGFTITDTEYVSVGVAMLSKETRDEVWLTLTGDGARTGVGFWADVAAHTPASTRGVVMAVTGMYAWVAGHGALLNICLEQAEAADPDQPLVKLLGQITDAGLPPSTWEQIRSRWLAGQTPAQPDQTVDTPTPAPTMLVGATSPDEIGRGLALLAARTQEYATWTPEERERVTQRALHDPGPMTVSRAVTLAVLLDDEHVRSTQYKGWTPDRAGAASDRLVAAAELLPDDPRIGGLLGCAGLGAWVSGNTVTLSAILDRAERVAPNHEETGFLRDLVDSDLSPSLWTEIRAAHRAVTHPEPQPPMTRDDATPPPVTTPTRDHVGISV